MLAAEGGREGEGAPRSGRAPGSAKVLAICFVAGPLLIGVELLRPVFAIILLLAGLAWLWAIDRFLDGAPAAGGVHRAPPVAWLARLAGTLAWILPSGIGRLGACHWDYIKHSIVFARLLAGHLPLTLGNGMPFHYYFAYYILPVRLYDGLAVLLPGLSFDLVLLGLYALLLFLSVGLLGWGLRAPPGRLLILLVLTGGGLDLIGLPLLGGRLRAVGTIPGLGLPLLEGFEWWGAPRAPQSFTMHLYWAPQHFFVALIGTALLAAIGRLDRPWLPALLHAGTIVAAATFWSPYVAIGLGLLVAGEDCAAWPHRGPARRCRRARPACWCRRPSVWSWAPSPPSMSPPPPPPRRPA